MTTLTIDSGMVTRVGASVARTIVRTIARPLAVAAVAGLAVAVAPAAPGVAPLAAQERLLGARSAGLGATYELWRFGDELPQPSLGGAEVRLRRVSQLSVPVTALVPIGTRFTVDVGTGFATGEVTLDGADEAGRTSWSLAGPTDTKVRLTGRLSGDNVLFTLGANLPTGSVDLDEEEYDAARVLAAPALGFAVPVLGNGTGFTAGLVAARQLGGVSVALGASYELRTSYSPVGVVASLPALDYNPSDAVRVSLMGDALVGRGQMTFGLSVDAFGEGEITTDEDVGTTTGNTLQLGPVLTGEWHWRVPTQRFKTLQLSVVDRYRTKYERDDASVEGSAANYLDVGLDALLPLSPRTNLVLGLNARHHTGLDSDNTIAAAAFAGGGLTFGLAHDFGGGYIVQPLVRAQLGRIETAGNSSSANGIGGGVVLSRKF